MASADIASSLTQAAHRGECVVIVGAGLAGMFTALKLSPHPAVLISPVPLGEGTASGWAQGGIAAAVSEGDTPEAHAADTIRAGDGIVDEDMARLLASEAPERIDDLLRLGVPFDRDLEGKLLLSREAAHSARRIARVKGDLAGKAIMAAVTTAVRNTPSIEILSGASVHELSVSDGKVTGVCLWPTGSLGCGEAVTLPAKAVVLASGGVGRLFKITTNPLGAHGEGLAVAARAGATISDAEFVQFHPTAIDIGRDPAPLVTEALRGEGATLVNADGKRYMIDVYPDAELAPRDVVARATFNEIAAGRGAFIDCRKAIGKRFAESFPALHEICTDVGLDPEHHPLPIAPAAHYHMGGVLTDADGRTTVDGLWACGEVACTGAHGANRLASNSLLETVVFGARIAADISSLLPGPPIRYEFSDADERSATPETEEPTISEATDLLRQIMTDKVGVVRDAEGLASALAELSQLSEAKLPLSVRNWVLAARFIAAAALQREESRGAHFRSDFPQERDNWKRHSYLTLADLESMTEGARAQEGNNDNIIHAAFGQ